MRTLRQLRLARGLTQTQLAEKVGMHTMTISGIERRYWGRHLPSTMQAVAVVLGVEILDIHEFADSIEAEGANRAA